MNDREIVFDKLDQVSRDALFLDWRCGLFRPFTDLLIEALSSRKEVGGYYLVAFGRSMKPDGKTIERLTHLMNVVPSLVLTAPQHLTLTVGGVAQKINGVPPCDLCLGEGAARENRGIPESIPSGVLALDTDFAKVLGGVEVKKIIKDVAEATAPHLAHGELTYQIQLRGLLLGFEPGNTHKVSLVHNISTWSFPSQQATGGHGWNRPCEKCLGWNGSGVKR